MTLDGDGDDEGTTGGEPEGDPADNEGAGGDGGDGGEGSGGDDGGDAGDGGEGTPPAPKAKPKAKAKGDGAGDGAGDDDPLTAGLAALGAQLEGAVGSHADALRAEMAQLKRDIDNRIELAERRGYGRGAGDSGGAGGPGAPSQQGSGSGRSLLQRLLW